MSRMKDAHIDLMNLEAEWLGFLRVLFEREGYQVAARDVLDRIRPQPDLALSRDEVEAIVELKLHRSGRVPLTLVRNAFIDVGRLIAYHHATRGILIIPQRLVESHYLGVREAAYVPIELWGLDQLLEKVARHPDLGGELANLLRALRVGAERPPEGPSELAERKRRPGGTFIGWA